MLKELKTDLTIVDSSNKKAVSEVVDFLGKKMKKGWKFFAFLSHYYGNHEELGDGDILRLYCFHPSVELGFWDSARFSHGTADQSPMNDKFERWLENLKPSLWVQVVAPDYILWEVLDVAENLGLY